MRNSGLGLACLCVVMLVGGTACAQTFFCSPPPPPSCWPPIIIEGVPPVFVGPPIYVRPAPPVVYVEPVVRKRPPKLESSVEIIKIDSDTSRVVRRTPKPKELQPAREKVSIKTVNSGKDTTSIHFLREVQLYDITITVVIKQKGKTDLLRSYEEKITYRDGRLYEKYWLGYDVLPGEQIYNWEEKVRWVNGNMEWVFKQRPVFHREVYPQKHPAAVPQGSGARPSSTFGPVSTSSVANNWQAVRDPRPVNW